MSSNTALAMIVNPHAGKKRGVQVANCTLNRLQNAGHKIQIFQSTEAGELSSIAESLNQNDWDGVIVVGGDGSLFEVLNGLNASKFGISLPLAHIPAGTGNSYIRDMGVFSMDDAIEAIIADQRSLVDLGAFTCSSGSFRFINLLGAGFVANVALRARKYKIFGSQSYLLGVVEEVFHLKPVPIRLYIDDEIIEQEALFVEICNSRFTGGAMMMAPSARINDGVLDVVIMNPASKSRVLKLLPKIFSGAHVNAPEIEVFRGKHIRLEADSPMNLNLDGETFGTTPLDVSVESQAIQIYGKPVELPPFNIGNHRKNYAEKI